MVQKTERIIVNQMQQAASDMAYVDDLYRAFRRIRHDFANYLQSSSFESEDEEFILRLRVLKRETLQQVEELLGRLDEIEKKSRKENFPWLDRMPEMVRRPSERTLVLNRTWQEMKSYFKAQLEELFLIRPVLEHLQDRLQRSLPPDEEESRIHLEECDSIHCHMTAEHVLLAAFVYGFQQQASAIGAGFRFQIAIPQPFRNRWTDLFFLLGLAREKSIHALSGNVYPADVRHDAGLIRIRLAEGMGLWHFFLEYGRMQEGADEIPTPDFSESRALKRILKKMNATLHEKQTDMKIQIDITG